MARNKLKKKAGMFLSNVKEPIGYDLPGARDKTPLGIQTENEKGQPLLPSVLEKGLKVGQGANDILKAGVESTLGIDRPVYDIEPKRLNTIAARQFLLRKEMGMDDEEANIMGGKDTFIKVGDNVFKFNPDNAFGKKQIEGIDKLANEFVQHKLETTMHDPDRPVYSDQEGNKTPETQYPYVMNNSVLGNIGFNQMGEGEDEKGYYNLVGGTDKWDFGLHPNESILDNFPVNIARTVLDANITPQQVDYETKVYIPGVKKQPRKKEMSRGKVFSAD